MGHLISKSKRETKRKGKEDPQGMPSCAPSQIPAKINSLPQRAPHPPEIPPERLLTTKRPLQTHTPGGVRKRQGSSYCWSTSGLWELVKAGMNALGSSEPAEANNARPSPADWPLSLHSGISVPSAAHSPSRMSKGELSVPSAQPSPCGEAIYLNNIMAACSEDRAKQGLRTQQDL